MSATNEVIGHVTDKVINTFKLAYKENEPIYCGESNRIHMQEQHPEDYEKYGDKLEEIIKNPDFIAKHPRKRNSAIEYIKMFKNDDEEHVLVAVRATGSGTLFARTLFVMDKEKVDRYALCGALHPYR